MELYQDHNYLECRKYFIFATFSASSAAVMKVFIPAALGAALAFVNTGALVMIVEIPTSNERTEHRVNFHDMSS